MKISRWIQFCCCGIMFFISLFTLLIVGYSHWIFISLLGWFCMVMEVGTRLWYKEY